MFRAGEWQATRKLVATRLSWCVNISCADGNGTVGYPIAPSICSCLTSRECYHLGIKSKFTRNSPGGENGSPHAYSRARTRIPMLAQGAQNRTLHARLGCA